MVLWPTRQSPFSRHKPRILNEKWFYDTTKHTLSFIPTIKDIATQKIEATIFSLAFIIKERIKNIVIKDLSVHQFDKCSVWAKGDNDSIIIINNQFENINLVAINFNLVSKNWAHSTTILTLT